MEALIRFLQNNPIIILVMFIITLLGGLMSIILGWKRFRDDILLKKITVPVYACLIILFVVALVIIFWPAIKDRPRPLQTIKGESFGVQRIVIDGKRNWFIGERVVVVCIIAFLIILYLRSVGLP